MRVSLAMRAVVLLSLVSLVGCTVPSVPKFWQKLSFKSKKTDATASASALATAPPAAPSFNANTAAAPNVSMQSAVQTSGSLPVYPGTNYPVTPYPAAAASGVAANGGGYGGEVTPAAGYTAAANPYAPQAAGYAPPAAPPQTYAAPQGQQYYNPTGGYNTAAQPGATTR